ncbi:MAG: ABC transporter permease [Bacteroidota bacterium]
MLRHHLLLVFRNFNRNKRSFFINLIGLSVGITSTLLIYLWVNDELSVDKFNQNDDRLYQVMQNIEDPNGIQTIEGTPGMLAKSLMEEIPEVELATSVVPADWFSNKAILAIDEKRIRVDVQNVDNHFYDVFTCELIQGNKNQLLSDKHNIAISEATVDKLFETTEDIIGKQVELSIGQSVETYQIAGVFKRPPANATAQYDILVNYELFLEGHPWLREWGNSDPSTFVLLRDKSNAEVVERKIHEFAQSPSDHSWQSLFLQPYSKRYLYGHYENGQQAGGRIEYVRFFSIVSVIVMIIACINFMNLTTAKTFKKSMEVGLRKAIGASRRSIIKYYFQESVLLSFLATITSILFVWILLPQFNQVTGKELALTFDGTLIVSLVGIVLFTGLLSGSFPALYLSGFQPAEVIKGKIPKSIGEFWARQGLVVFQFTVSVILIVSVMVIYKQIEFVQSKNLGYDREHVLHFNLEIPASPNENFLAEGGEFEMSVVSFLNEAKDISGVINAANFYHDLISNHGGLSGVDWEAGDQDESIPFSNLEVGYGFIETLDIEMVSGRAFSRDYANDRSAVIFNQTAINQMGLADPIGKSIRLWGQNRVIIGVAKDFNFESLYEKVKPCVIQLEPRSPGIILKVRDGSQQETIANLEKLFHAHYPGLTFDYRFVDDDYQALYLSEKRVSTLSQYFATIAILISCLGLFGLATFTIQKRLKEIGIRKVLGSSEVSIVKVMSKDLTNMVIIAICLGIPISILMTTQWLQNFAYSIELSWWYFVGGGLITLVIAWLTVGFQTIKAAMVNPAKILRSE